MVSSFKTRAGALAEIFQKALVLDPHTLPTLDLRLIDGRTVAVQATSSDVTFTARADSWDAEGNLSACVPEPSRLLSWLLEQGKKSILTVSLDGDTGKLRFESAYEILTVLSTKEKGFCQQPIGEPLVHVSIRTRLLQQAVKRVAPFMPPSGGRKIQGLAMAVDPTSSRLVLYATDGACAIRCPLLTHFPTFPEGEEKIFVLPPQAVAALLQLLPSAKGFTRVAAADREILLDWGNAEMRCPDYQDVTDHYMSTPKKHFFCGVDGGHIRVDHPLRLREWLQELPQDNPVTRMRSEYPIIVGEGGFEYPHPDHPSQFRYSDGRPEWTGTVLGWRRFLRVVEAITAGKDSPCTFVERPALAGAMLVASTSDGVCIFLMPMRRGKRKRPFSL